MGCRQQTHHNSSCNNCMQSQCANTSYIPSNMLKWKTGIRVFQDHAPLHVTWPVRDCSPKESSFSWARLHDLMWKNGVCSYKNMKRTCWTRPMVHLVQQWPTRWPCMRETHFYPQGADLNKVLMGTQTDSPQPPRPACHWSIWQTGLIQTFSSRGRGLLHLPPAGRPNVEASMAAGWPRSATSCYRKVSGIPSNWPSEANCLCQWM